MKYKTAITQIKDGKEYIHGKDLQDLAKNYSFAENIFFLLKGVEPSDREARMMNTLLSIAIDHGPGTASGQIARIVASAKTDTNAAVAAGILAMGQRHGGAIEGAMEFFYENYETEDVNELVSRLKELKVRIPGYGHATLTHDHRVDTLFEVAKETGYYGAHCQFAESVRDALAAVSSKPLPINVDGGMAAVLCDMGFDIGLAKGIFIIARVPGLVVQSYEEVTMDEGLRRLSNDDIEYID